MVDLVGRRKHLALIHKVNIAGLENLSLDEMSDANLARVGKKDRCLCHDRDTDCCLDLLYHLWVAHSRDPALLSDIGRYTLQGHDG